MQLPKAKIDLLCVKGPRDNRTALYAPYLDAANKKLVVTNGKAMAVHNVTLADGDTSGHVPLEAIRHALKKGASGCVVLNDSAQTGGVTFPRPYLGPFPDYQRITPAKPDRAPDLVFDAALLLQLAQALNADGVHKGKHIVRLWKGTSADEPIYVEAFGADAVGVFMPCLDSD